MSKMKATYGDNEANYTRSLKIKSGILFVWCIILTIVCLLPIYILVLNATRSHNEIISMTGLGNLFVPSSHFSENVKNLSVKTSEDFSLMIGYKNSLTITVCSTFLTVFFSAMTAYGIRVYDFKLKDAAYTAILLVMMVPVQVTSAGFVKFMINLHLTNSFVPLILPAVAAPSVVYFMVSYLKSSFSQSIVEAARIDGCSEFRIFLQIAIPMMKPAIAVQAIFAFIASWNNFYTPNMILIDPNKGGTTNLRTLPMMLGILQSSQKTADYGMIYTCIALGIIPIIIAYICLSKFIIAGVALGGVKE
ncbi:MAG: carbohydrate ABC transporter permease [Ruminococcus sp.]|nr:carbohydrate ABC transporter permease [Ruminococcus sp.]